MKATAAVRREAVTRLAQRKIFPPTITHLQAPFFSQSIEVVF
jgi:hypothetical protein